MVPRFASSCLDKILLLPVVNRVILSKRKKYKNRTQKQNTKTGYKNVII